MASIQEHLDKIKNAIFGKDVRQAIHDSIEECYRTASVDHDNANMEVKRARGTHETLNDRLVENEKVQENFSSQLDSIALLKSNGIDDTQNIISQLQKSGEVRLDEGEYIISNIKLHTKNRIVGKGKKTILKAKNGTTGCLITLFDDNVTDVCISNLIIDGNKENADLSNILYFNKISSGVDLFSELSKLVIKNSKGNGIHLRNGCREITLSEIDLIKNDGYGLYDELGSDNKFINITATQNILGGIKETGASNRWVNIKTFYNGDIRNRSTGFWIKGTKSITLSNVESQENFGLGLFIDNCNCVFGSGITLDSNGITSFEHIDSDLQYSGVKILDSMYINLQGNILNYRTTKCQKCGLEIDGNGKSYYNFSILNQEENFKVVKGLFDSNLIINGKIEIEQATNNLEFKRENGNATLKFYDENGIIKQVITSTDSGNCTKWDCQDNNNWYGTPIRIFDDGNAIFGANGKKLGFFTSNGIPQQTAFESATDLDSAIALVNNLKDILTGYGLIK